MALKKFFYNKIGKKIDPNNTIAKDWEISKFIYNYYILGNI